MSKLSDDKREVLAYIDAILTMIEKYPTFNLGNIASNINLGVSVNPFDFLLSIISKKVTDSEMIDWLVNILTYSLPAIELGVKGVLLSNLKQTIDCNNDPRIPMWLRQDINGSEVGGGGISINNERGFIFNVKNIDYNNLLSYSPLSERGQMKYFGTKTYYKFNVKDLSDVKYYSYYDAVNAIMKMEEDAKNDPNYGIVPTTNDLVKYSEIDSVYELARASDFNAFLWFVINKAYFTKHTEIKEPDIRNYSISYNVDGGTIERKPFSINSGETSVLDCFNGEFKTTGLLPLPFTQGSTIIQKNGDGGGYYKTLSMCLKMTSTKVEIPPIPDDDGFDFGDTNVIDETVVTASAPKNNNFTFVPVSSNYRSANWYVNSGTYYNFLKPEENRIPRDYNKDFALCNLECLGIKELSNAKVNGEPFPYVSEETYLRFTILPAPLIHTPAMGVSIVNNQLKYEGEAIWRFKRILFNEKGEPDSKGHFTVSTTSRIDDEILNQTKYTLSTGGEVIVNWEDGSYYLNGDKTNLIECYPGLTVYDFNYNYVMGMQLFDPAVVASQLIEMATNIAMFGTLGINLSVNKTESAYQMRVAEIVKNIVESTAFEASDCFYSFSNEKYNDMLEKSELKRSQGYAFSDSSTHAANVSLDEAYSILSEFDDNATLNENKEVITRAITTATAKITEEVLPEDRYNVKLNLVQELIKGLVMIIVESLLTPKIILLFEVNKQLMGGHDENLTLEDFLNAISGLITAIVVEIRDIILRELLNWALSILTELLEKLSSMLVMEQIEYYTRLMKGLLKACKIKFPSRKALDSQLDNVDYADIDEIDKPITSEC